MADLIKAVEAKDNENIPQLAAGDTVSVHVKIKEGERERIQEFKGLVIRLRNSGNNASVTFAAIRQALGDARRPAHYRPPHGVEWYRRGAHLPAPLTACRQDRGGTPRQGPPRPALLHAFPHR